MKKYLILAILLFTQTAVYSMDFMPALDINAGLSYPTLVTGESAMLDKKIGADAGLAGSFMVNTDLIPQLWFIPTLTMNYSSTAQPLSVDDQRFIFSQWLDVYFSGGLNYQFDEKWELRLRGIYRLDFAQQTADETFGNGLYDYNDRGFYIENSNTFGDDTTVELTAGFKYIDKRFPNYKTLVSQVDPDTIGGTLNAGAKNEKDNTTYSAYLSCEIQAGDSGWFPEFNIYFDYTPYTDQQRIEQDGTLSGFKRIDRLAVFEMNFPYYDKSESAAGLGYSLAVKTVSQNYYDSMSTIDPADDIFTRDFYNYLDHNLNFSYTYAFENAFLTAFKPALTLGLYLDILAYTERYAKNSDGNYTLNKQLDFNYRLYLAYKHKLTDFWSYNIDFNFSRYNSNMKWEAYGTYNYSMITLGIGTSMSF